ncbi:MAG: T9SS type A sorting domain-containing protein [Ginsengibacter sp.]
MKSVAGFIMLTLFSIAAYTQPAKYDSVPVRLSTLEAGTVGNNAKLMWKVVCFLQYAKFEIQRSPNGVNYSTIDTFEADQLRCRQPFDFTDPNITGKTFYRIRVGDLDGKFYHSKVVAVTGNEKGFEINALSPSFVTTNTALSISSAAKDKAEIVITNFQGMVVKRFTIKLNKGVSEAAIDLTNIAKGNYVITVTNSFSMVKTIRFVKL